MTKITSSYATWPLTYIVVPALSCYEPFYTLPAAIVYFIKDITPDNLVRIYEALGRKAEGNNVAVKISTGESEKSNYLRPEFIASLVRLVDGTIIECNTAYNGNRSDTESHRRDIEQRGFGKNFLDYDFTKSMSEVCQAVFNHTGDKILFINVANRLSVDCDYAGQIGLGTQKYKIVEL